MSHKKIFGLFQKLFPLYSGGITWFPNGKNSIRIRIDTNKSEFIFTYENKKLWKFETIDSFLETI